MAKAITERMGLQKEWYEDAQKVSADTLPDFIRHLTEDYSHDYGTICHAVAAAAVAAGSAVNHSQCGGITGFQAGAVMWEFIRAWNYSYNKTGLRLIDYDNFLYPQYADKFEKTLSPDTWAALQNEAAARIAEADADYRTYLNALETYKLAIADFVGRYPDYYENREHYDPLGMGTGEQWKAEYKKKASGFEFAPQEPYCPVTSDSPVYRHWASIVEGNVPFGYSVEKS